MWTCRSLYGSTPASIVLASDPDPILILAVIVAREPGKKRSKAPKSAKAKSRASEDDAHLTTAMDKLAVTAEPEPETQPKSPTMSKTNHPAVIHKNAELYLWDQDDGHFLKQADVHASISKPPSSAFDYVITAMTLEGQQLFAHKLTSDLNARWSTKLTSLTWNHTSTSGVLSSWCFKFENLEDFKEFQEVWGSCLYETLNHASWAKAKVR